MTRAFRYLDREWQAYNPPRTAFQYIGIRTVAPGPIRLVEFKCVSCRPEWKYESSGLSAEDASEEQLCQVLDSALRKLAREEHSPMPPDLARDLLDSMPDKGGFQHDANIPLP
jgi:hypothetical protein